MNPSVEKKSISWTKNNTSYTPTFILVIGASGDVAKKKIYPALFELYIHNYFESSSSVQIYGFARSELTSDQFRNQIRPHLVDDSIQNTDNVFGVVDKFLSSCQYYHGSGYNDECAMRHVMSQFSIATQQSLLLVYLAIPPNIFPTATSTIRNVIHKMNIIPFNNIRIVLEKPFGHDTVSCRELLSTIEKQKWHESNLFRIDHYLGKAAVRNILLLRQQWIRHYPFWTWNNRTVQSVHILLKETITVEGRGGYYDSYGAVRDVIQNHLLQILTLLIMELPNAAEYVRDYKVQLLEQLATIRISDCIFGQYEGYLNDKTIQDKSSKTPTYACIRLFTSHNTKWAGVPFYLEAGKALDVAICEVRIKFKGNPSPHKSSTTFVIRIQPSPAMYMEVIDDHTDRKTRPHRTVDFADQLLQDVSRTPLGAYAALILEVLHGQATSFVRADELLASWRIFTPMLHEYERSGNIRPVKYSVGSSGPIDRLTFLQTEARSSL